MLLQFLLRIGGQDDDEQKYKEDDGNHWEKNSQQSEWPAIALFLLTLPNYKIGKQKQTYANLSRSKQIIANTNILHSLSTALSTAA